MLVSRCGCLVLAAFVSACSSLSNASDAGREGGWAYDGHFEVRPNDGASTDATDVSPTVDVIVFDASIDAPSDAAAPGDASNMQCASIADEYARIVRDAQTCTTASDCSTVVCETICCNCQVYVNGSSTLAMLSTLESAWEASGCDASGLCTPYMCGAPAAPECTSAGRCATVRRGD
jgi:hypothetical protein